MSKRSERKRRKAERRSKTIRESVFVLALGLIFLAAGIYGLHTTGRTLREYQQSPDVRTVEAQVVSVEIHDDPAKDENSGRPQYVWDATLEFIVDDSPAYTGTKRYYQEVAAGQTVRTEVYLRPDGTYAIPEVTDNTSSFVTNIPMYAALAAGGLLSVAAAVVLAGALRGDGA